MSGFDDSDLTRDSFMGGRVWLRQPRRGYRAGVDPVLLASVVNAVPGQRVLELGCGAGTAILCLAARVPGLSLTGVELQQEYADLAQRNAEENGTPLDVVCADLTELPAELRQQRFDHVIANPPYFRAGAHSASPDAGRRQALGEMTPLAHWVSVAARRLVDRGFLHIIQRSDRLPDLLAACEGKMGSVEVLPLSGRLGRAPELILLRARKGGRGAFRLHAPVVMHEGPAHDGKRDKYTSAIDAVLRQGMPLEWPGHTKH